MNRTCKLPPPPQIKKKTLCFYNITTGDFGAFFRGGCSAQIRGHDTNPNFMHFFLGKSIKIYHTFDLFFSPKKWVPFNDIPFFDPLWFVLRCVCLFCFIWKVPTSKWIFGIWGGGGSGFYLSNFGSPKQTPRVSSPPQTMGHPSLIFRQDVFQNPSCLLGLLLFSLGIFLMSSLQNSSKFTEIFTELLGYCLVDASTTCTVPGNGVSFRGWTKIHGRNFCRIL